jgi:hypothetical protein
MDNVYVRLQAPESPAHRRSQCHRRDRELGAIRRLLEPRARRQGWPAPPWHWQLQGRLPWHGHGEGERRL